MDIYFQGGFLKAGTVVGDARAIRERVALKSPGLWGVARPAARSAGGMRQHTWALTAYGACGLQ